MAGKAPTIIPGTRFGHLELTGGYKPSYMDGKKRILGKVECKCDCGSITYKPLRELKTGNTKTCSHKCDFSISGHKSITHGLSTDENSKITKEYSAWTNMKRYCDDSNHKSYKYCGAKGITYHESLSTIVGFWEVMGAAPSKYHQFIRIDKEGDYEPGNVRWYLPDGRRKK